MTTSGNRTAEDPKSSSKSGAAQKPSAEVAHERPADDPGRGQGDVFDDKLPPESNSEANTPSSSGRPSR